MSLKKQVFFKTMIETSKKDLTIAGLAVLSIVGVFALLAVILMSITNVVGEGSYYTKVFAVTSAIIVLAVAVGGIIYYTMKFLEADSP